LIEQWERRKERKERVRKEKTNQNNKQSSLFPSSFFFTQNGGIVMGADKTTMQEKEVKQTS